MTPDELHELIDSVPAAKKLAQAGNDGGCAAEIASQLPPLIVSAFVGELGVLAAFADPGDGDKCMQKLESAAGANPLLARTLKWMQPPAPGVDMGDARTRAQVDILRESGVISDAEAATLKALAERPATVTAVEVSAAWARHRPDGKVGA